MLSERPNITPLIFSIILRFRIFPIAITADIEKAFLPMGITGGESSIDTKVKFLESHSNLRKWRTSNGKLRGKTNETNSILEKVL